MTILSSSRPGLRGRVLTKFPSLVIGENGFKVVKQNGVYVFQPDFGSLGSVVTIPEEEFETRFLHLFNSGGLPSYEKLSLSGLLDLILPTTIDLTGKTIVGATISGASNTIDLEVDSFGNGVGASSFTFLRGDGVWAVPDVAAAQPVFNTRADAAGATISAGVDTIRIAGYSDVGDGGGALYKRVDTEPSHAGKIQSADGAWWEIAETQLNVRMFGAVGDGSADDTTAIQSAIDSLGTSGGVVLFPQGTYITGPLTLGDGVWSGGVATAVATKQNIVLRGIAGHGGATNIDPNAVAVALKYKATATDGGTLLTVMGPGSFGVENLRLDANAGRAGRCLTLMGVYRSRFENLTLVDFSTLGLWHLASPTLPEGLFISAACNQFINVTVFSTGYGAGRGIDIGSEDATVGSFDVARDLWLNPEVIITDSDTAVAVILRGVDLVTFVNPFFSSPGQRRAHSVYVIPPTAMPYLPQNISFINASLVGAIFTPTDGSWTPSGSGSAFMGQGLFFAGLATGDMMDPGFTGQAPLPSNPLGGIQGFTTDGRRLGSEPKTITTTTYTLDSIDGHKLVEFNNASGITVAIPQPTQFNGWGPCWTTAVHNNGAGLVALNPTSSTINGLASLVLEKGQGATIWSDGSNYHAVVTGYQVGHFAATADGTALTNSTTETALKSAASIPGNLLQAGDTIRLRASGVYTASAAGTTPVNLAIVANIAGVPVSFAALAFSQDQTNAAWHFENDITIRTNGASGTMQPGYGVAGAFPYVVGVVTPNGANIAINTTSAGTVAIKGQWSAAASTNSVTCRTLTVEILKTSTIG